MPATVIVHGFEDLQKELKRTGPEVSRAMNAALKESAEPARVLAGLYARRDISGMKRAKLKPPPWSIMRVGVTTKMVYVAPVERGVKTRNPFDPRRRPNLFGLIMDKAFEPASIAAEPLVARAVDSILDEVLGRF
jgi:hypothetical protein